MMRWPAVVALKSMTSMTPARRGFSRATARTASVRCSPRPVVLLGDLGPAGFLGDVEADQLVVLLDELARPCRLVAELVRPDGATSSSNTSERRLRKISGRM